MKIDKSQFIDKVERWQKAEPVELSANFHALKSQGAPTANAPDLNKQFVQVDSFTMDEDDLKHLKKQKIEAMFLWMALDDFDRDKFTFQPILEIETKNGKRLYYDFESAPYDVFANTQEVPTPFVKNTRAVWRQMNIDNIANMFINEDATGPKRVRYYMFTGNGLKQIIDLIQYANKFQIFPGIDLNKETEPEDVLFIPIVHIAVPTIKVTPLANAHEAHLHGFGWSVNDDLDDNIYFDYTRPCPPVCNNH